MAQLRIWNFGDPITQTRVSTVQKELFETGIYSGYDATVIDPATLQLSIGYLLLPDGILLTETTELQFAWTVMPAIPTDYTIVVTHTDSNLFGGTAAFYNLETGLIAAGSVADGVVIAWIRHPGSGAALSQEMIIQPAKRKVGSFVQSTLKVLPNEILTPFDPAIITPAVHHSIDSVQSDLVPLQVGTSWPQTQIVASGATVALETSSFVLLQRTRLKPAQIELTHEIDLGCQVEVRIYDVEETSVLVNHPIIPVGVWIKSVYEVPLFQGLVPNGVWTPGEFWRMEILFKQPLLTTCGFLSTIISYDPLQ